MNDKNLDLMDDIMRGVYQSDEWQNILAHDPSIVAAAARWSAVLTQVKDFLPKRLYMELDSAHTDEVTDTSEAGILFGIHVADAIRDVASRPADLSRYALKGGI